MLRWLLALNLLLLTGLAGYGGFRLLHSGLESEVYRTRLREMADDNARLRELYNEAIRKTAVTELLVDGHDLSIAIRTADGERRVFPTPFDATREIYVDFVVVEGRLWIRRVFDSETPPGLGLMVDPQYIDVDWDDARALHGKAVYRALEDGRWVVSVTGDGSLGLERQPADGLLPGDETAKLTRAPSVRDYAPIREDVRSALRDIEAQEVLRTLAQQLAMGSPIED
jgi:hypothetical protein